MAGAPAAGGGVRAAARSLSRSLALFALCGVLEARGLLLQRGAAARLKRLRELALAPAC
jgi:hypothetical protein